MNILQLNIRKLVCFVCFLAIFFVPVRIALSSGAVLIDENRDNVLDILANTKLLEGKPALFFTQRLQETPGLNDDDYLFLANHINNFVLVDSLYADLPVDFATEQIIQIPKIEDRVVFDFPLEINGIYEIYLDKMDLKNSSFKSFDIQVNGIRPAGFTGDWPDRNFNKYYKIGDVNLISGKQRVSMDFGESEGVSAKQSSFRLLIVKKNLKNEIAEILKDKMFRKKTQFCYVFKNNTGKFSVYNDGSVSSGRIKVPFRIQLLVTKSKEDAVKISPSQKLIKIDGKTYVSSDFKNPDCASSGESVILSKDIYLSDGLHVYERINSGNFIVKWAILEQLVVSDDKINEPGVFFKRINPAKYIINIRGASAPFWLIFSESYHKKWTLFKNTNSTACRTNLTNSSVTEGIHSSRFEIKDIKYLRKTPLNARHFEVNGYANTWYIDPKYHETGENFSLVLYFLPQSYFYLGLILSAAVCFFSALLILIAGLIRKLLTK